MGSLTMLQQKGKRRESQMGKEDMLEIILTRRWWMAPQHRKGRMFKVLRRRASVMTLKTAMLQKRMKATGAR